MALQYRPPPTEIDDFFSRGDFHERETLPRTNTSFLLTACITANTPHSWLMIASRLTICSFPSFQFVLYSLLHWHRQSHFLMSPPFPNFCQYLGSRFARLICQLHNCMHEYFHTSRMPVHQRPTNLEPGHRSTEILKRAVGDGGITRGHPRERTTRSTARLTRCLVESTPNSSVCRR